MVLDFGMLLPGPLASLMLCEAGARVIKIERPGRGDDMRHYEPRLGADSTNFHMLNRGKESLVLDLKNADDQKALRPWLERADILVEQFRPGVMAKFGLDYETVSRINPRMIYCSVTGWGQTGPRASIAGHDLNFFAESGLAQRSVDAQGDPILPPALIADIACGSMPAVINVLLALLKRQQTGKGCYIDVAMCDALPMFAYADLGEGFYSGHWTAPNLGLTNGGSPRYQYYRTSDARHIAAAPMEERFWVEFCRIIGLPDALRDSCDENPEQVRSAVAEIMAQRSAADWMKAFGLSDVCCSLVCDLPEAVSGDHQAVRKTFGRKVVVDGVTLPALPLPIARVFQSDDALNPAPRLGERR
ncbi:CaiB/BaiF CoA transferase family protein [Novosphingobium mangrovi (ex Huang et al. 2023)]|uniref:CoA transferase n=1 Tax=Novosphingobium mangrovi (ex Huang et al. 2023) TaxID=2976432 RepID=A0ABT2I9L6_9SPHN|nr:CoA transferase [Novosphingobium mangrovi (ex Huang et al. 2023)]MCT2401202.1 CoA transferase [Novosphingobium mangrovi (ex Huang et al. 2023)]